MFDLELALGEWRQTARGYSLSANELDELEDHLHSTYLAHQTSGRSPAEAFGIALRALGTAGQVSSEYRKVRSHTWIRLLKAGWAAFAVAFLLPVVDGGITLLNPELGEGLLPGFQAFRFAVTGEEGSVGVLSALTNVLMLATMWRATALGRERALFLGLALSAAALLNGWWMTIADPIADLRVGYYVWWSSFGFVSAAVVMRARALAQRSARATLA